MKRALLIIVRTCGKKAIKGKFSGRAGRKGGKDSEDSFSDHAVRDGRKDIKGKFSGRNESRSKGRDDSRPCALQQLFGFGDHVIHGEAKHLKQLLSRC